MPDVLSHIMTVFVRQLKGPPQNLLADTFLMPKQADGSGNQQNFPLRLIEL
jgi:hypothetical protein